ncbi:putative copine [Arabidopsis thaliana]
MENSERGYIGVGETRDDLLRRRNFKFYGEEDRRKQSRRVRARSFNRQSLHYIGTSPNPYQQAISIIGKTLYAFDEDNLIPCYGFGDGPTSFAPIIERAMTIVEESGGQYHSRGWSITFIPFFMYNVVVSLGTISCPWTTFTEYLIKIAAATIFICVYANFFPTHSLGPPLNTTYLN